MEIVSPWKSAVDTLPLAGRVREGGGSPEYPG